MKMMTCEVCGGEDFKKHAGFFYCAVCQTQSQDYYEQEYEYHHHKLNIIRRKKTKTSSIKTKKPKFYDDGMWTTWEVYNYILFGMTEEIKKCGVANGFEEMVFKLWAAYLKECQAVFISRNEEKIPKLGFNFKQRDARILYSVHVPSNSFKGGKTTKECSSKNSSSFISNSTSSSRSRGSIALQKGKMVAADYRDLLSVSMQSSNFGEDTCESSDGSENLISSLKQILRKKDYQLYKSSYQSETLLMRAKAKSKKNIKFPGKNKLLSIIHLALLMIGSEIQLSDLLRFIREGHLSFAKVTHFFPKNLKLPKNDFCYIEVTSDSLMPTHLRQRQIASQLACLLKIAEISMPNMDVLVDRYCQELNLPEQLARLSKEVLREFIPSAIVPRSKILLPSCEAWAMVSIIFVMKLLFGLNDRTEVFLSQLASEVNATRSSQQLLFVFEEWQKHVECRKSILSNFHYPTLEQVGGSPFRNSKKFLEMMMRESKDEYRNERFIPYSDYYIEGKLLDEVKQVLKALSKPLHLTSLHFQPSLKPQKSQLEILMGDSTPGVKATEDECTLQPSDFAESLLKQSFKTCDLEFAFDPKSYANLLMEKTCDLFEKFGIDHELFRKENIVKNEANVSVLMECSSTYWMLKYPNASCGQLGNFREEVFEKTPKNFQWLMSECARMLEMNVRDVYDELLSLEQKFVRKKKPFEEPLLREKQKCLKAKEPENDRYPGAGKGSTLERGESMGTRRRT